MGVQQCTRFFSLENSSNYRSSHNLDLFQLQILQIDLIRLNELLQVMNAFYARSASKFIELLPWSPIWFGEESDVRVVNVIWLTVVRWF